jgi:hypothetical protein
MSGQHTDKAALVSHPLAAADPTGLTNVHRIALTGVAQSVAIPASWKHKFCLLTVDTATANVQYAFSAGAAATLVRDQAAAIGTGSAVAGATIFSKASKDGRIRAGVTHLNFISDSADGYLEIEISETPS